jgi:hypothetical protein
VLIGSTAMASAFIRDYQLPNLGGITPIHAFTVLVAVDLPRGIWQVRHGNVAAHRRSMRRLYIGACVLAGVFTLLPGRFLAQLLWHDALGVVARVPASESAVAVAHHHRLSALAVVAAPVAAAIAMAVARRRPARRIDHSLRRVVRLRQIDHRRRANEYRRGLVVNRLGVDHRGRLVVNRRRLVDRCIGDDRADTDTRLQRCINADRPENVTGLRTCGGQNQRSGDQD